MPNPDPLLRLFIALELPEAWKQALGDLQDDMREGLQQRFGDALRPRWVRPEAIHLTLKFLGETPPSKLDSVTAALRHAVPDALDFNLELANIGSFADRRSPRVILAGLQGQTRALTDLATRVETWLASAGWPRERRGFHPHLTLARLPETLDDATRHAIADLTTTYSAPPVDPWHVESASLVQSHLGAGGARYERLGAFPSAP